MDIALQWITTGELSSDNRDKLKAQYLEDIGAPKGCKTCGSVWSDIKHHFSYQLKLLNLLPVATKLRKFIIAGAGFLMLPGSQKVLVNDGENSEDREVITDLRAEEILAEYPSYDQLIVINPAWAAANAGSEKEEDSDQDSGDTDELTAVKEQLGSLQAKYDDLAKEHEQTKSELSTTKGLLTRANNKLAKQSEAATTGAAPAVPADPAAKTDAATTGETGTAASESTPSTGDKGNAAADATASVVEGA